jgi:hypothetical protein
MKIARCLSCLGRKTIVALGNMQKTCPHCLGVGYLEQPDKVAQETMDKPKRTRKKKIVEPVLQCLVN